MEYNDIGGKIVGSTEVSSEDWWLDHNDETVASHIERPASGA
jgi:hypothetical protein